MPTPRQPAAGLDTPQLWAACRPEALAAAVEGLAHGPVVLCGPRGCGRTTLAGVVRDTVLRDAGIRDGITGTVAVVDDADRLDPEAVLGLQQAAAAGGGRLVVTVATDRVVPAGIGTLWRSGLARRVELGPLGEEATGRLLEAVLGGAVTAGACRRLHDRSAGNLRWLRLLIDDGLSGGWLRREADMWWVDRAVRMGPGLAGAVTARLAGLGPAQQAAARAVAVAEPVPLAAASELAPPNVLEELEGAGWLIVAAGGGGTTVRLADRPVAEHLRWSAPAGRRPGPAASTGGSPAGVIGTTAPTATVATAVWAAALAGRLDAAVAAVAAAATVAAADGPGDLAVVVPYVLALGWGGWTAAAAEVADRALRRALDDDDDGAVAVGSAAVGLHRLAAGDLVAARQPLQEAAVALDRSDPLLPLVGAELARLLAMSGDADGAGAAVVLAGDRPGPMTDRARGWTAVAAGDRPLAERRLAMAAAVAAADGQDLLEAVALHDLVRLGRPAVAVDRLGQLAAAHPHEPFLGYTRHAVALAAGDPAGLEAAARQLEVVGDRLAAAEGWAQAATAAAGPGAASPGAASPGGADPARARRAAARSRQLARSCGWPTTPALAGLAPARVLTRREAQIAALAGQGMTARQIAATCHLAERTVENHLHRTYAKLGVAGRRQLAVALAEQVD